MSLALARVSKYLIVVSGLACVNALAATEPAALDNRIRTQFAPRTQVVLSSELAARIASLPLRDGEAFRSGQTLVVFDCSQFQAQQNKAQALLDVAKETLTVNKRLAELNAIGTLEVQQNEAKVKEATAEVAFMHSQVKRCSIAAPFSGRVAKRLAAAHQYVAPGTPLLDIIDTSELEVQMIVSSKWLSWLKPGTQFGIKVDELGRDVNAKITRIGARIDPVSQTVSVTGTVDGKSAGLLPGMSGWAMFRLPQ